MAGKSYEFAFALAARMNSSFTSTFTTATKSVKTLKASFDDLNKVQQAINNASTKGIINEKSFANAQKQLNVMNKKLQNAAATEMFQKSFIDATAFYYGAKNIVSFLAEPVQAAMQFESVMADVKKVVDFDTPGQFKQMGKDIINLSKSIPMTADGLAKIVAAGGQSGIARGDLTQFAESAAKMGVAFDISADQAGEMMAKWRTAFKMNQQEVVTLADKINYLGNTTAASAPLISDVVTRIGPLGAVGGLASGEIAAMGASLIGSGIQSEVAATGLKNFILAMTAGTSATKTQKETFKALGFEAEEMAEKMQKDAKGAIIELLTAINGMDKVQQSAILKDLFGKESISAIAPLLSNLDNLKKNFDGVADATKYAGSMQAEFDARSKTTENSVQLMENRVNAAKIAIGNGLLPVVADLSEGFGKLATLVGDAATEFPRATKGILAVVGAGIALTGAWHMSRLVLNGYRALVSGLSLLFGKQTAVISANTAAVNGKTVADKANADVGKMWTLITKSNTAATIKNEIAVLRKAAAEKIAAVASRAWAVAINVCTTAQRLFNLALAGTPIGLVLVGISALVVAGTLLYKNWDKVKTFFTNLWENPTARMLMFVTGPIGLVIGAVTYVISHWDELKSYLQYFWDNPAAAIFRFQNYLKEQIQGAIDWVFKKWEELKNFLSNPISVTVAKNMLNSGRYDVDNGEYEVGKNATGGIYGKGAFLTTFAEESGESAIPHTPTKRNIGLLAKTNQIMGNPLQPMLQVSPAFNPTINVAAATPAVNMPPIEVSPASVNVEQAAITAPSPVIQVPESKPILQAPPVIKNMIQAVADSPIVKTFVKAVAAVPDIIVNPASPVLKPIFTSMAKVPDVIVNQETMPPAYPQAPNVYPVVNVPKADTPIVNAMAKVTETAPILRPIVNPATPVVNVPGMEAPKVNPIINATAPAPNVNMAPPAVTPIVKAIAPTPIVNPAMVQNVVNVPKMDAPGVSPVIQATAASPEVSPVFNPLFNVPKADTPQVKIGQRIQALAKTPVVTAMFNPQAQPAGLPDINVPQSTQKETLVERIKEIVRPQERPAETAPINITFSPNIVVNGNADRQEVQQATEISFQKFRELMEQFQREQRRVQYG